MKASHVLLLWIPAVFACNAEDHKLLPEAAVTEYKFRFGNSFAKGMVLQMGPKRAQIWGHGRPFSEVVLTMDEQLKLTSSVNQLGQWFFKLRPHEAGGPHAVTVQQYPVTANTLIEQITLENIMFGDVWLCAGGSNMAQELNSTLGADKIITALKASRNSNVKMMQISREAAQEEQHDVKVSREWAHAGPYDDASDSLNLLPYQPALCLLFGMKMAELHPSRPIGLVEAAWGGTPIEAWVSQRVTDKCQTKPSQGHFNLYSNHALWNGMISPLAKMTIRGVIWNQGEANVDYNRDKYACHVTELVKDWRNCFSDGKVRVEQENAIAFPFGLVQLGPSLTERHEAWSELRLSQTGALLTESQPQFYLPNIKITEGFMASTYDLSDSPEVPPQISMGVHYKDKATVAERLALASQALMYNSTLPHQGPRIIRIEHYPEQWTANVTFDQPIIVNGTFGFSKQLANGEWMTAPILLAWPRGVVIGLSRGEGLAYGRSAAPCAYKHCAVYSDDAYRLPAVLFQQNFAFDPL